MARLFKLSQLNPLKCHREDCVPNVLAYIDVIGREDAFKLANMNDQILTKHVVDYLTQIYGVNHGLMEIYTTDDQPTPDMVEDILDEQNTRDLLDDQLNNNTVAIGLFLGKVNHLALFGKINHELYIIDTQTGETISLDDPNLGLYLYKYDKINLVTTEKRTAARFNSPSKLTKFKKNAYMYTIKQRIRANPNAVRWSRYLLHHHDLIPSKKYKIVNKKTNKSVTNSVFLRFEGNNAVFQDITVPTAEHFFIELSKLRSRSRFKSFRSFRSLRSTSNSKSKLRSRSIKHSI
jgi:hypothetical protein